jgi:GlpG protein
MIGHLSDEAQARRFSDFLVTQGVRNAIECDGDGAWSLWVHDENQVSTAQSWFSRFSGDPGAAEFRNVSTEAAKVRDAEAEESAEYRRRVRTRRSLFPGSAGYGAGYLTYALIVTCVTVSLLSKLGHDYTLLRHLFISFPENGSTGFLPEVRAGEVWRLFTPALIHFGPAHLLFNMLWLFQLGSMIESRQGHLHFALLMIGLALGSNVAQYTVDYATNGPPFGGMSGVIYGLFGYVWLRGKFDPASGLYIDRQNVILMIVWFFACWTGYIGRIANTAHATGLILGAAYGCVSALVARRNGK